MNLKQLLLFSVVLFKGGFVCAQTINTAKLDSFFNVLARINQTSGSFAVAQKGKLVIAEKT